MIQQRQSASSFRDRRPLYSHLVGLLESAVSRAASCRRDRGCRPSASSRRACASAARRSSAPIASSSRADCCVGTWGAARSSARRRSRRARPSPGAARSRRLPCARVTPRCATLRHSSDAASFRSRLVAGDRLLSGRGLRAGDRLHNQARAPGRLAPRADRKGSLRFGEAIAERFSVPAESVLMLAGAQQGLDLSPAASSIRATR
jgi:hypothetical protein